MAPPISVEHPVLVVLGTRPEAIKLAPVVKALEASKTPFVLLSTGQHSELLEPVLESLELVPDHTLDVLRPGQSLNRLASRILEALDPLLERLNPRWIVVQGDTTTVAAVGLAAALRRIPLAHVEAGLRTHDRNQPFPEELQRSLLAPLADLHFAPTVRAQRNLLDEGVPRARIRVVGNTAVDALYAMRSRVERLSCEELGLPPLEGKRVVLATAHRRENLGEGIQEVFAALAALADRDPEQLAVVLPVHRNPEVEPLARSVLGGHPGVFLLPPLAYSSLVKLLDLAELVVTDSGGIQEETTALGVPTLVTRNVSERPEAIESGVAELVGTSSGRILEAAARLLDDPSYRATRAIPSTVFGDGRSAERIVSALIDATGMDTDEDRDTNSNETTRSHATNLRQTIWIVLPSYNEEIALPKLVADIDVSMYQADLAYRIVVVDDGSTDRTASVAEELARRFPLRTLRHRVNQGLGATIRDGLLEALRLADPVDIVITMDADHSHNPQTILRMVRLIREGNDVVIASRYRAGSRIRGVPLFRRCVSYWGNRLLWAVFPTRGVRDYTSGYRAYRCRTLRDAIGVEGSRFFDQAGFQCMLDILLRLRSRDLIFTEVPFVLRYDLKPGQSKMKVARTIVDTLGLVVRRRLGIEGSTRAEPKTEGRGSEHGNGGQDPLGG